MESEYPLIVQFRIDGFGTEDDLNLRFRLDDLLDEALQASGNGYSDGGDTGSGTMNLFLYVKDLEQALKTVLSVLDAEQLTDKAVIALSIEEYDEETEEMEIVDYKVFWPEGYTQEFDLFDGFPRPILERQV